MIPTGDGVILAGVHKAFLDLRAAGLIRRLPRLICVQAEKSCAIHQYFSSGTYRNAPNPVLATQLVDRAKPAPD